jgi:hypothetical protein
LRLRRVDDDKVARGFQSSFGSVSHSAASRRFCWSPVLTNGNRSSDETEGPRPVPEITGRLQAGTAPPVERQLMAPFGNIRAPDPTGRNKPAIPRETSARGLHDEAS